MSRDTDTEALEQAAAWRLKLAGSDATLEDWQAFEGWLAAGTAHVAAYDRVEAMDEEIDALVGDMGEEPVLPVHRRRAVWPMAAGGAAVLAAVVGLLVWTGRPPDPALFSARYVSPRGATRLVKLPDGTTAQLNTGSTLDVRFDGQVRRVSLDDAEVAFDVTHDPSRPFIVSVGDREVRVVGTEFDIARHQGRLTVTVRRGLVRVEAPGAPVGAGIALRPGQQFRREEGSPRSEVGAVDPEAAFAWRSGHLDYRDRPLQDVVSDLNRYFDRPIRLDPSASSVRFTGVLAIDRQEAMVSRLVAFLPIERRDENGAIVLRRKSGR